MEPSKKIKVSEEERTLVGKSYKNLYKVKDDEGILKKSRKEKTSSILTKATTTNIVKNMRHVIYLCFNSASKNFAIVDVFTSSSTFSTKNISCDLQCTLAMISSLFFCVIAHDMKLRMTKFLTFLNKHRTIIHKKNSLDDKKFPTFALSSLPFGF